LKKVFLDTLGFLGQFGKWGIKTKVPEEEIEFLLRRLKGIRSLLGLLH